MTKNLLIISLCLLPLNATAESEYIEQVEDRIYTVEATAQEILKRSEFCIVQTIKSDEVKTIGTSTGYTGLFGGGQRQEVIVSIPALPLIKFKDESTIYINNRIGYRSDLVNHTVQTEIALAVKDNKFKISNTNIQYLQNSSGYGTPPIFQKLPSKRFASSLPEDTVQVINDTTESLANCLMKPKKNDW